MSPAGAETVLYSFTGGADGGAPGSGVIQDTQSNLYGSTNQDGAESSLCIGGHCGVVFKLSPTGIETVLHTFTGTYGANPVRSARDVAGNLYGGPLPAALTVATFTTQACCSSLRLATPPTSLGSCTVSLGERTGEAPPPAWSGTRLATLTAWPVTAAHHPGFRAMASSSGWPLDEDGR